MTETPIQDAAQKSPAARSPRSHYVGALDGLRVLAMLAVLSTTQTRAGFLAATLA